MNKVSMRWLTPVVASVCWGCLPLVDGRFVGEPLTQITGTVDFIDAPPAIFEQGDFKLALIWKLSAEHPLDVSVSRTESRTVSGAGTFAMDLFSLPLIEEGRWVGRIFAFLPVDGLAASWTERWNSTQTSTPAPTSVLACSNVVVSLADPDTAEPGQVVLFTELAADAPEVAVWQGCVDDAAGEFYDCRLANGQNGDRISECETRWRTRRAEACGDEPLDSGASVSGPLSLRCRFSVEDVPPELTVDLPAGDASLR